MNFFEKITGSGMTKEMKGFETRAKILPKEYRVAWEAIKETLWQHSDFTGRNLMPVLDGVLFLLEDSAAEGRSVADTLGDDIRGFCLAVTGDEGAKSYRDKWRAQLNQNVMKKLGR